MTLKDTTLELLKVTRERDGAKANLCRIFASEAGLVGHPKLQAVFDLAWERGGTYAEVRCNFFDFAALVEGWTR